MVPKIHSLGRFMSCFLPNMYCHCDAYLKCTCTVNFSMNIGGDADVKSAGFIRGSYCALVSLINQLDSSNFHIYGRIRIMTNTFVLFNRRYGLKTY